MDSTWPFTAHHQSSIANHVLCRVLYQYLIVTLPVLVLSWVQAEEWGIFSLCPSLQCRPARWAAAGKRGRCPHFPEDNLLIVAQLCSTVMAPSEPVTGIFSLCPSLQCGPARWAAAGKRGRCPHFPEDNLLIVAQLCSTVMAPSEPVT